METREWNNFIIQLEKIRAFHSRYNHPVNDILMTSIYICTENTGPPTQPNLSAPPVRVSSPGNRASARSSREREGLGSTFAKRHVTQWNRGTSPLLFSPAAAASRLGNSFRRASGNGRGANGKPRATVNRDAPAPRAPATFSSRVARLRNPHFRCRRRAYVGWRDRVHSRSVLLSWRRDADRSACVTTPVMPRKARCDCFALLGRLCKAAGSFDGGLLVVKRILHLFARVRAVGNVRWFEINCREEMVFRAMAYSGNEYWLNWFGANVLERIGWLF